MVTSAPAHCCRALTCRQVDSSVTTVFFGEVTVHTCSASISMLIRQWNKRSQRSHCIEGHERSCCICSNRMNCEQCRICLSQCHTVSPVSCTWLLNHCQPVSSYTCIRLMADATAVAPSWCMTAADRIQIVYILVDHNQLQLRLCTRGVLLHAPRIGPRRPSVKATVLRQAGDVFEVKLENNNSCSS